MLPAHAATRVDRREIWSLFAVFLASRLLALAGGVRFDLSPLPHYWQVLDPQLLATDLFRSVWFLHSQPPLWNLFLGAVLHLPERLVPAVFQGTFLALGLGLGVAFLALLARLRVARPWRFVVAAFVLVQPATILAESLLFYTLPVLAALVGSALFLHRFLEARRGRDAAIACCAAAVPVLTHSLFHLIWLSLIVAVAALGAPGSRRTVVRAAVLPCLLATLWYARSQALFGTFSASSWLGMSLARTMTLPLEPAERQAYAARPREAILAIPPFSPLSAYPEIVAATPPRGAAVLDRPQKSNGGNNYHHAAYLEISRRYLSAARAAIERRPGRYLHSVGLSTALFFRSAADSHWFGANAVTLTPVSRLWDRYLYGQLESFRGDVKPATMAWGLVLLYGIAVVRGARLAFKATTGGRLDAGGWVLLYLFATVVYVTVAGNAFEIGENHRFRLYLEPFLWALALAPRRPLYSRGRSS